MIMKPAILISLVVMGLATSGYAQDAPTPDTPHPFNPEEGLDDMTGVPDFVQKDPHWDWIRLTSGEWLKGDLRGMERDDVDFDSDELGGLTLDWDDISAIYSYRPMSLMLDDGSVLIGVLRTRNKKLYVIGPDQSLEFKRVIGLAVGLKSELDLWTGNVSVGLTLRTGNVEQRDIDVNTRFVRRTAHSTVRLSYVGNYTENDDIESANDHRANGSYDYRLNRDWFLRPIGLEYYRDKFQNIDNQWKANFGAGYYLADNSNLLWTLAAGPGYQEIRYSAVPAGQDRNSYSYTFAIETEYDQDLTSDIDLYWSYSVMWANTESGRSEQHGQIALDFDLISDIDLRIAAYYDYIQEPQADENGVVPDSSDYRFTVGLNYDL